MASITLYLQQLKEKYGLSHQEGFVETDLDRVSFFWTTEPVKRSPLIYNAGIAIVGQGHKIGYLGDRVFYYDTDNYLVVSMAIPFECATYATPDDPLLGLFVDIDLAELHELVAIISKDSLDIQFDITSTPNGMEPVALNTEMRDVIERLAKCLCSPLESKIFGHSLVKEIIFHALLGKHGSALYALTQHNTHYMRIAKSLSRIRRNYSEPLTVHTLAEEIGMSISVFHRSFKQVTGSSPLQYLKKIRLNRAKSLILHENIKVTDAATRVGYESPSQFSREFKRYFGVPPTQAHNAGYREAPYR